jgi:aminopeptidase YwaD
MNMIDTLLKLTSLGARPIGSPANQSAADMIREGFRSFGLDAEDQPYPCTAWEAEDVLLELGNERLEAEANAFSLACDVTAPLVSAGTLTELESISAHGKFLLLYGDLTRAPLSPKSWFLKDERDEHIIQILESMQPAAIIAPPTSTDYYGQLTEDWELDLPAITVPSAVARRLIRHADSSIHLKISARRIPAQARNIVARKAGRETGRIVLCSHFDSKINTPGASDNAAGVAVLLELAERLSKRESRFGMEFIAFNGEEYLPIGDDEYMRRAESYFPDIRCVINLDGIGPMLASTSLTALSMPEAIEANMRQILADFPGVVWVEPWYESNHSTFAMRGIPALAVSAVGTRSLAHQPYDDAEGISAAKLEEVARLVEAALTELEAAL